MATADELLTDALKLPSKDRARLAHELLLSLDVPDKEPETGWTQELGLRVQDVISGKVKLVSVEESNRRAAERIEQVRKKP